MTVATPPSLNNRTIGMRLNQEKGTEYHFRLGQSTLLTDCGHSLAESVDGNSCASDEGTEGQKDGATLLNADTEDSAVVGGYAQRVSWSAGPRSFGLMLVITTMQS